VLVCEGAGVGGPRCRSVTAHRRREGGRALSEGRVVLQVETAWFSEPLVNNEFANTVNGDFLWAVFCIVAVRPAGHPVPSASSSSSASPQIPVSCLSSRELNV